MKQPVHLEHSIIHGMGAPIAGEIELGVGIHIADTTLIGVDESGGEVLTALTFDKITDPEGITIAVDTLVGIKAGSQEFIARHSVKSGALAIDEAMKDAYPAESKARLFSKALAIVKNDRHARAVAGESALISKVNSMCASDRRLGSVFGALSGATVVGSIALAFGGEKLIAAGIGVTGVFLGVVTTANAMSNNRELVWADVKEPLDIFRNNVADEAKLDLLQDALIVIEPVPELATE